MMHTPSYAPPSAAARGRILLVCFRFGPGCDTGGFRWNAMVRDLTASGWCFDVITVGSLEIEGGGAVLNRFYHDGAVEIFQVFQTWWGETLRQTVGRVRQRSGRRPKSGSTEPGTASPAAGQPMRPARRGRLQGLEQTFTTVTQLMRDMNWVRRARRIARRLARERRYQCVIVSSPRHLTHLVGADVARRYGMPYIADYRDPWYYGRGIDRARLDVVTRLLWWQSERRCLRQARFAIDVSEGSMRAAQQDLNGKLALPRYFIPNGYDYIETIGEPDYNCFRVLYTGTLYEFNPVPEVLAACKRLRDRHQLAPDTFRIQFMGIMPAFEGQEPDRLAQAYGLDDCFEYLPRRPASVASSAQQSAAVLLAFDSVCVNALCIPSKLFHYAQMKGLLLLVGDPDGAMAHQGRKIQVPTIAPADSAGLDDRLESAYTLWRRQGFKQRNDHGGLFDSRRQSQHMHELLRTVGTAT